MHKTEKSSLREWIEALVIVGLSVFIIRTTLFNYYNVPTGSAEPTILAGDFVFSNKLAYKFGNKPQRGDYVTFDEAEFKYDKSSALIRLYQKYVGIAVPILGLPAGPINVTKRVIAIPGDWIEGRIEDGKAVIYLNGKKLHEPYLNPYPLILLKKKTGLLPFDAIGSVPIPEFLKQSPKITQYSYDPDKHFENQPFYTMKKSDVVQIPGVSYLAYPGTPTYKDRGQTDCADVFGPMKLPENKYWLMGDNRKGSMDARWFGLVDESLIHGRVSFIIGSIDTAEASLFFELLKHPIDFWRKSVRWNRFFSKLTPANERKAK